MVKIAVEGNFPKHIQQLWWLPLTDENQEQFKFSIFICVVYDKHLIFYNQVERNFLKGKVLPTTTTKKNKQNIETEVHL